MNQHEREIIISPTDMFTLINSSITKSQLKYMQKEYFDSREGIDRAIHLLTVLKDKMYKLDERTIVRLK